MSESTYSVYLVQRHGEQGGEREVTSPVQGHTLDFYDTGVWLDRETGRNFFPYEQIRTIREHSEGREPDHESERRSDRERRRSDREDEQADDHESEGTADSEPTETDPRVEGDSGAEEEMLEE